MKFGVLLNSLVAGEFREGSVDYKRIKNLIKEIWPDLEKVKDKTNKKKKKKDTEKQKNNEQTALLSADRTVVYGSVSGEEGTATKPSYGLDHSSPGQATPSGKAQPERVDDFRSYYDYGLKVRLFVEFLSPCV